MKHMKKVKKKHYSRTELHEVKVESGRFIGALKNKLVQAANWTNDNTLQRPIKLERVDYHKGNMEANLYPYIFVTVGLIPEYGSTYNLPRLVGIAKACELALTGKVIDAKEAKEIGLVNQVVPVEELEATTKQMAKSIAQWPTTAVQLTKRLLYQGLDNNFAAQLQFEAFGLTTCMQTEDHAEALKAFMEKRKPIFKGK